MDRVAIKSLAKEKIKGNKWNLIWPLLVISIISSILTNLLGGGNLVTINADSIKSLQNMSYEAIMNAAVVNPRAEAINTVVSIVIGIITAGYVNYVLTFVRNGSASIDDIMDTIKKKWLQILLANILVGIIVFAFSLLLVIPGIVRAIAYAMVTYIIVDSDLEAKDALKKSREMMNGYKWDYFVFNLSFIGWFLLVPFTFGIILIWLIPYMNVAEALYYEKLKEIRG